MSRTEQKFVNMVVMKASGNPITATRAELELAISLLDEEMKGKNPKLYAAMMDSRAKGF